MRVKLSKLSKHVVFVRSRVQAEENRRGSFDPFCLAIMQFLRYLAAVCLASVTSLSLQGCSSETTTETTAETATVTMTTTMTMTMTTTMTSTVTTVAR
eukprot:symbB.v1.2.018391.t1/scaffold1460.1/size117342/3